MLVLFTRYELLRTVQLYYELRFNSAVSLPKVLWMKHLPRYLHVLTGGQLICLGLGGHFKKTAFTGGPYLLMEIETSLG